MNENKEEPEEYGDSGITSADAKVPGWLKFTYMTLPIWGFVTFFLYWNGAWGWLDRGYWEELETAANTKFPLKNYQEYAAPKSLSKRP